MNSSKKKIKFKVTNHELDYTILSNEYSSLSNEITDALTKEKKKTEGIFFTPPSAIKKNLKLLEPYFPNIKKILEPSCGSGEYITAINKLYPNKHITGIEYNEAIFNKIQDLECSMINLQNMNMLDYNEEIRYDLIIGNPPYFVMKKNEVDESYYDYFDGRPNIFILFIVKCLNLLNDNGILSFVLPRNFTNCQYYEKTRKYIANNLKIIDIVDCDGKYTDTQQKTIILIVQKNTNNHTNEQFILDKTDYTIFGKKNDIKRLYELYDNSTVLNNMGFNVNVGTVVWNQCKDILSSDTINTRLVYSSDISNNKLIPKTYNDEKKKNFIKKEGLKTPCLVVNRGFGVGAYNFNYCLIEGGFEYLIENHLISINYIGIIDDNNLIELYKKIIQSFEDPRTKEFVKIYCGNNALNTTELENILPIYQDI